MRLDLFLKASRLASRRSAAQELCDAGLVAVNGTQARSSKEIKVGDEIAISRRDKLTRVQVKSVPESKQVSKADAPSPYEILENTTVADDLI